MHDGDEQAIRGVSRAHAKWTTGATAMTTLGHLLFWSVLGAFGVVALLALMLGWWLTVLLAAVFAAAFAATGPFVLGRRWRPAAPRPTRRPVRYRRPSR